MTDSISVMDREIALKIAITTIFPNSNHLLCMWHINKNLLANQRSTFDSADTWDDFMRLRQALVNSASITEYNQRYSHLSEGVPRSANAYLLGTGLFYKDFFYSGVDSQLKELWLCIHVEGRRCSLGNKKNGFSCRQVICSEYVRHSKKYARNKNDYLTKKKNPYPANSLPG